MKKFLIILLCGIFLVGITGCANETNNNVVEVLNKISTEQVDSWAEQGYYNGFTVHYIQEDLDEENNYIIITSGDKKFTTAPSSTEYTMNDIPNYDGTLHNEFVMMGGNNNVNYIIIYDIKEQKYYNVEINYEKTSLNGAEYDYPVFSNAEEIK